MWKKLTILLIFLILVSLTTALDLNSGLIGVYKLENLTEDVGGHNLSTAGSPITASVCKDGGCYQFDSIGDVLRINDMDWLPNGSNQRAISFWMLYNSSASQDAFSVGYGKLGASLTAFYYGIDLTGSSNIAYFGWGGDYTSGTSATAGVWKHMLYMYDGSKVGLYYDGNYLNNYTSALVTDTDDASFGFSIGNSYFYGTYARQFYGMVDEVYIWNRTLNASEIANLSAGEYYPFNVSGGGSPPPATNNDFVTVTFDKNFTDWKSVWSNWTTVGNYSYTELRRNDTLIYNGSNKYYNDTTVANNTQYFYNITVFWNSTIFNSTVFNVTTQQFYVNLANIYALAYENNVLLDNITEVLNMLGIVFIWAFINFAAFFLLSKGQYLTGWFVYGFASFFDLFLSGYLINLYQSIANPGTFYGLTASFLIVACSVWILLRVAIPFTYKTYSRR